MDTNSSFMERYLTPIAVVIGALILAIAYVYGHGAITGNTPRPSMPRTIFAPIAPSWPRALD